MDSSKEEAQLLTRDRTIGLAPHFTSQALGRVPASKSRDTAHLAEKLRKYGRTSNSGLKQASTAEQGKTPWLSHTEAVRKTQ